ncbi:MAG: hypothetical protein GOVbin1573_29 [Prokaryotic dsDNA virus sp.]|nr:MAG: hypothetical protein GOVbin1573_29 [Prokaryotic dsDNA virus sp.]
MLPTLPKHYGSRGQEWPPGSYWLVEHVRPSGPRLFWMDDYDPSGRTGWSYLPCYGAGFGSREEAEAAFQERGRTAVEGGKIMACEHEWG